MDVCKVAQSTFVLHIRIYLMNSWKHTRRAVALYPTLGQGKGEGRRSLPVVTKSSVSAHHQGVDTKTVATAAD